MSGPANAYPGRTTSRRLAYLAVALGLLALTGFFLFGHQPAPNTTEESPSELKKEEEAPDTSSNEVVEGSASNEVVEGSAGGVEHYHCASQSKKEAVDLVLLHGASFTKENWKRKGILDEMCQNPKLSVTAMDFNHRAGHKELIQALGALRSKGLIQDKPVALVTPSASGYSVIDWIGSQDVDSLTSHVGYWIPVASPSIKHATDEALQGLKGRLPILAVYGSRDSGGKKVSERLQSLAQANVVEINDAGHACYLDNPDDFINELMAFLPL